MTDFVWPSDRARSENPELDRVCDQLEESFDQIEELERKLAKLEQGGAMQAAGKMKFQHGSATRVLRLADGTLHFGCISVPLDQSDGNDLVRYCPECGTIGEIDKDKHANCCPDGNRAVYVPQAVANQARAGFHAGIYWLVWSNEHSAYWRPNRRGYTRLIDEAGIYSFEDAFKICRLNDPRAMSALSGDVPPEVMVPAPKLRDAIRAEKP